MPLTNFEIVCCGASGSCVVDGQLTVNAFVDKPANFAPLDCRGTHPFPNVVIIFCKATMLNFIVNGLQSHYYMFFWKLLKINSRKLLHQCLMRCAQ